MNRQIESQLNRFLLVLFGLVVFGLIQVYSSSYILAHEHFGDGLFFFKKQAFFVFFGLLCFWGAMKVPLNWIERWGWVAWVVSSIALILTFVPGLGVKVGGAQRWLPLPMGFRLEPCELIKLSLPFLLARYAKFSSKQLPPSNLVFRGLLLTLPMVLLLAQPDFGSFFLCSLVTLSLLFALGLRWRWIGLSAIVSVPAFYFLVMQVPYRRLRVMSFLNPWENPQGSGFQLIQSLLAFHSGGLSGVGLGDGQGKLFFLPAAHTDFTLAVLGEELGFLGFLALLISYGYLIFSSLRIVAKQKVRHHQVLGLGLVLMFSYSVFVNVAVTLGLLPTKGLTLPFLSYGGSSLIVNCILFGILVNLYLNGSKQKKLV